MATSLTASVASFVPALSPVTLFSRLSDGVARHVDFLTTPHPEHWNLFFVNWAVQFVASWVAFSIYIVWDYKNYKANKVSLFLRVELGSELRRSGCHALSRACLLQLRPSDWPCAAGDSETPVAAPARPILVEPAADGAPGAVQPAGRVAIDVPADRVAAVEYEPDQHF